jgi:hypothetical protein
VVGRRSFVLASAGALAATQASFTSAAEALSLHVFVQTQATTVLFDRMLEAALPGVAVRVFNRSRDFDKHRENGADAVMSLLPVLEAQGHPVHLQGVRNASPTEPYVFMSSVKLAPASAREVGAADLLGRSRMPAFIQTLLGGPQPSVTLVTKLIDLIALIQFEKVDGVVLPERHVRWLEAKTRLTLFIAELPNARVGLPAVSFLTPSGRRLGEALVKIGPELCSEIGVDTWR